MNTSNRCGHEPLGHLILPFSVHYSCAGEIFSSCFSTNCTHCSIFSAFPDICKEPTLCITALRCDILSCSRAGVAAAHILVGLPIDNGLNDLRSLATTNGTMTVPLPPFAFMAAGAARLISCLRVLFHRGSLPRARGRHYKHGDIFCLKFRALKKRNCPPLSQN